MQFKTAILASAAALTASAAPAPVPQTNEAADVFGIMLLRSASEIHFAGVQAARTNLMVNAASQNASCDAETNTANFYIQDEELYLYAASATPQKIFVDRSGMGMGKIGYVTGAEPLGKNWETKGWAIDENQELKFKDTGFQACPGGLDGGWSLWLQGSATPGHNEGCLGAGNRAVVVEEPIGCLYTQE